MSGSSTPSASNGITASCSSPTPTITRSRRVLPLTRSVQTTLGSGAMGLHDGASRLATFSEPSGLSFATFDDGRDPLLFIADTNNHTIRVADLKADEVRTLEISGL